jgi:hypothetical protein
MSTKRSVVRLIFMLMTVLMVGCGSDAPTAPSDPAAQAASSPPPVNALPVTSKWNVTMTLSSATGDGCLREAVQALLAASGGYTIVLAQTGDSGRVSLEAGSHNYDCSFDRVAVNDSGFTSVGVHGWYRCTPWYVTEGIRCSDGSLVSLYTLGQNISGSIAGDEIRGTWTMDWFDHITDDRPGLEVTAQYTGRRQ